MFILPDLPYATSALEPYIDKATMELHHDKHHAAYVKNLNDVLPDRSEDQLISILGNLSNLDDSIRTKVQNHGGGHYNHTLFWNFMSPKKPPIDNKLQSAINTTFTSNDNFQDKFTSEALGQFGSGWAWLVADHGQLEIIATSNQNTPLALGKTPLLCIDVWEHAYYLKYQNRRAEYIQAWFNVVNCTEVSARFAKL